MPLRCGRLTDKDPNIIMFRIFLIAFLSIPLLEIWLLIHVGQTIGAFPTVLLVIATAVAGAALLRQQGLATLLRAQHSMAKGELPAMEMLEGVVIAACGVLLLTPGFFTDILGLIGLIPATRQALIRALLRRGTPFQPFSGGPGQTPHGPRTLEGEWRREDD